MKKLAIICILFLILQNSYAQYFHFGFRAAPTFGWFKPDYNETIGNTNYSIQSNGLKVGFSYGLMTEFGFTENYLIATGIDVAYRNGNLKYLANSDSGFSSIMNKSYTTEYIEIPFSIKLMTNEIGYIRYYGQFGLSLDLNIRAHANFDSSYTFMNKTYKGSSSGNNVFGDINPLTMSLVIGAGIEYSLQGHIQLTVGITFNNGFIDILKDKDFIDSYGSTHTLSYSAITNYIALNFGIFF
jgi:hypothetical protein